MSSERSTIFLKAPFSESLQWKSILHPMYSFNVNLGNRVHFKKDFCSVIQVYKKLYKLKYFVHIYTQFLSFRSANTKYKPYIFHSNYKTNKQKNPLYFGKTSFCNKTSILKNKHSQIVTHRPFCCLEKS